MNVEGYVLELIKTIEEKGYDAYIAGSAVLMHCLEKPIEEYDIITSAPLFFIKEGKQEHNRIILSCFTKRIEIYFETSIEEYKKYCSFQIELLFYHPKHGIVGTSLALQDVKKHRLNTWKRLGESEICKALYYKSSIGFSFTKFVEEQILSPLEERISLPQFLPLLEFLFTLDQPSLVFQAYPIFFQRYFHFGSWISAIDYLMPNFFLRFSLFLLDQPNDEDWIEAVKLDSSYKKRIQDFKFFFRKKEPIFFQDLYEKNIVFPWFSIQRAIALSKQDYTLFYEIEERFRLFLNFLKNYQSLNLTIEDLMSIGFTKEEGKDVLSFLKKEILLKNVPNQKEILLAKANKIYKEKWD